MIKIELPGRPIPLERHRSAMVGCKIRQYDCQKRKKAATTCLMMSQISGLPGPRLITYDSYEVHIIFNFYKPKHHFYMQEWDLNLEHEHNQKPDVDNLIKYILDCGNRILWTDDSKVTHISAKKQYAKKDGTEIYIVPKKNEFIPKCTEEVMKNFTQDEIIEFSSMAKDLFYFFGSECDYTAIETANSVAKIMQDIASRYAEKLMKIKKHGGKNGKV